MDLSYTTNAILFNGYKAKAFAEYFNKPKVWAMGIILATITYFIYPELQLCWWLYALMFLDFITAYIRERTNGRHFTFDKMRNTISKTIQYTAFLMLLWCLLNISGQRLENLILAMNSAYWFLIVIESKSISENIRDISPDSNFSKYVLSPFLALLEALIKRKSEQLKKTDIHEQSS